MTLAGKVALVTGGSRGIGLAVARALHAQGVRVMICARYENEIAEGLRSISEDADIGTLSGLPCDVRDAASVERLIADTVSRHGALHILINNAGVGLLAEVEDMSLEDWRTSIDTNLTGAFYCCHYAIPHLKLQGGDIINMASRSSVNPYAGGGAYCASKFGLLGLSECLHLELRKHDIRVSCIMPGRVGTDFAGEDPQDWHLSVDDVASCVISSLLLPARAVASRIELRPSRPGN